jgi:hypothetical protein
MLSIPEAIPNDPRSAAVAQKQVTAAIVDLKPRRERGK